MNTDTSTLDSAQPILAVPDVAAAIAYYRDTLGFGDAWLWGDPPTHGGVRRDRAAFQFSLDPERAATAEGRQFWVRVTAIDSLYGAHAAEGAAHVVSPLEAKPWGMREYTVRDLNGYHLRFAEPADGRARKGGEPPAGLRVEARVPTPGEYRRLIAAVGWDRFSNPATHEAALAAPVFAVVARVGDTTVGCALLLGDGASFYYVKDVMVLPEYQGRRIGTALMRAVMDWFARNAPDGSRIGLFTGSNLAAFYEPFGFRGHDGLYGMSQVKWTRKETP